MTLGTRLVELRNAKGINRKQLAEALKIPYNTLRNYENGEREPGHTFLIRAANYFSVTLDYLLGSTDEPSSFVVNTMLPYAPTRHIPILGRIAAGIPLYSDYNEHDK